MKKIALAFCLALFIFSSNAFADPYFKVVVDTQDKYDRAALSALGLPIEAVDMETGRSYLVVRMDEIDRIRDAGFFAAVYAQASYPQNMEGYHDEAETTAVLLDLANTYPDKTSLFSIGQTFEGRQIMCLKISDNAETDEGEPAFFLVARHHAREPISSELALETATRLLTYYDQDPFVKYLVDEREIYIVPRLNMDGAAYDEEQDLVYWRKNRRPYELDDPPDCDGVDLNRNYGHHWGSDMGSSGNPCNDDYRGASAFSEPATQSLLDFVEDHENITFLITLHSFGEMILYPWGYKFAPILDSDERDIHTKAAAHFAAFSGYLDQQASDLYPTSGDTTDWAYGELGIFSFTFELAPAWRDDFYPPDTVFDTVFNGNWPAMTLAAGLSADPEMALSCDLWRFAAEVDQGDVVLSWSPIVETDGTGYDILRADTEPGPYEIVNDQVVSLGLPDYEYVDTPGRLLASRYYKIRFNSSVGRDREFGPLRVEVDVPTDDDDNDDDDNDTPPLEADDDDDDADAAPDDTDDENDTADSGSDDGCGG